MAAAVAGLAVAAHFVPAAQVPACRIQWTTEAYVREKQALNGRADRESAEGPEGAVAATGAPAVRWVRVTVQ